jgi:threonine dehydrogenase-like Zn-dependent dehydrogenase
MKQIIQSYKTGDLWLADVPIPACKSGGVLVQTRQSFVSAGTERMLVDFAKKNLVVKIPDEVSFEDGSCATVGSIALQGVRQCDLRLGENVCVMGLGLLGLLAVQMFKASGVRVIGFDPDAARCDLARDRDPVQAGDPPV